MPHLVENTTLVEDLIDAVSQLHFADVQENTLEMEEYGEEISHSLMNYANTDLDLTTIIEEKLLMHVTRKEDQARLIAYFSTKF